MVYVAFIILILLILAIVIILNHAYQTYKDRLATADMYVVFSGICFLILIVLSSPMKEEANIDSLLRTKSCINLIKDDVRRVELSIKINKAKYEVDVYRISKKCIETQRNENSEKRAV